MTVTVVDLFAFGKRLQPRLPRPNVDFFPDEAGMIGPERPPGACGASLFADPVASKLEGHFHCLPAGTLLPAGVELVADGVDVDASSEYRATHHTLYPAVSMSADRFVELFMNLPWTYGGRQ